MAILDMEADGESARPRVDGTFDVSGKADTEMLAARGGDFAEGVSVVIDPRTGGTRVRKVVCTSGLPSSTSRMLRSEGDILQQLDHPNIVKLQEAQVDSCGDGEVITLMLEHLAGGDCNQLLRRHGSVPEHVVAGITRQVLHALAYCHARGIAHRDVNPGNVVLVAAEGRPRCKLIDFGLSGLLPQSAEGVVGQPSLSEVVGSPAYIAPEMLVRRPCYDAKVDVWSVGAFAFELLTGRPPFGHVTEYEDFNPQASLRKRIRQYATSEDARNELAASPSWKFLSQGARDFLSRVLQADPALRPSAMEAASHSWLVLADAVTPQRSSRRI